MTKILREAKLTEKRSKFLAVWAEVRDEQAIKALIEARRRKLKKARHHCWAARLPAADGSVGECSKDDGEVGRPGQRLLETMRRHDALGVLLVSRIFGGVKLGPAGVGRAFKDVAEQLFGDDAGS
jgi:putative IMPACT (imprinted ancient) family translation regulator